VGAEAEAEAGAWPGGITGDAGLGGCGTSVGATGSFPLRKSNIAEGK